MHLVTYDLLGGGQIGNARVVGTTSVSQKLYLLPITIVITNIETGNLWLEIRPLTQHLVKTVIMGI